MTDLEIPDPDNDANGLPVTHNSAALEINSYIVWLHLRYTEVDDKPGTATTCNGIPGYTWYGSLSYLMKRLWPALAAETDGSVSAARRINRYLFGTNNAVCLDRGRMDQANKRRKTHRLPEWFIAGTWQQMQVIKSKGQPGDGYLDDMPEPPEEFEPEYTETEQDPFIEQPTETPAEPIETPAPDAGEYTLPLLSEGETDNVGLVCRVGCDREFARAYGRVRHERNHMTVDAILAACVELLVEYEGDAEQISRNMIAERAGVAPVAIGNHFHSKADALATAARLRGAPFIQTEQPDDESPAPQGPLELTQLVWDHACGKILDLAAFAAYNDTPLSYEMLSLLPWELNPVQRREVLNALIRAKMLQEEIIPDENGRAAKVLVPTDPNAVAAFTPQAPVTVDPVAMLQDLLESYTQLVHRDQNAAEREHALHARIEDAEKAREELNELKRTMARTLGLEL
jgi:AcrR family transcriptional regulator